MGMENMSGCGVGGGGMGWGYGRVMVSMSWTVLGGEMGGWLVGGVGSCDSGGRI